VSRLIDAKRAGRLAGAMLALMVLLAIIHGVYPGFASWPAGLAAWLAGALLVPRIAFTQKLQLSALVFFGVVALAVALSLGAQPHWLRLLDANAGLLTMIAAVSFLRLVALTSSRVTNGEPMGRSIYRQTLIGVALFGAFINISAPILIADRLTTNTKLSRFASQSITRVFSGCSAWSPFFGGMAVVLTYVADTKLLFVMIAGIPFAMLGLALVSVEADMRYRREVERFTGYPMTFSSLWIPVVLVFAVAAGAIALPQTSILLVIAIAAIAVTCALLAARYGVRQAAQRITSHIFEGLPGMVGELSLFIAAGVLAVGLTALVNVSHTALPISEFGAFEASVLLGGMVFISALGVHPVITIAAVTPLLAAVNPDSELLAMTYLLGWSLGTCASPLSGTHLIFQGRYGVPSVKAAMWNWPFAIIMFAVGVVLLNVVASIKT
jgi:hypothetical protein